MPRFFFPFLIETEIEREDEERGSEKDTYSTVLPLMKLHPRRG